MQPTSTTSNTSAGSSLPSGSLYNASTGVIATPTSSVTAQQTQNALTQGFKPATAIPVDSISSSGQKPITLPPPPTPVPSTGSVPQPANTTLGANGQVTLNQPTTNTSGSDSSSLRSFIQNTLMSDVNTLGTQGAVKQQLETENNVFGKSQQAVADYNAYLQAKADQANTLEKMRTASGGLTGGNTSSMDAYRAQSDAHITNLSIQANISQGLLDAANKAVSDKLDAQFSPIKDQVSVLNALSTSVNNDMTESEKTQAQIKATQLQKESNSVQTAASDIHQTLLKNNAPTSAYDAVDSITQKYIDGKISASKAQSQMYAAATKFTSSAQNTTYTPGANPVIDSHISNILNGNETMQQVPANLRNAVSLGLNDQPATSYTPIAASRFSTAANRIASNYINLPQYQLTANGLPYLQRIDAAMKVPGSVSDQDLLDSLTKLNTAGNAISDAQVRLITDGRSFSDAANVFENKLKNGGVLSDNQRQQIQKIAQGIYANYQKGYQPVFEQVSKQLTAAGIPKAFWGIPDLNNLSAQSGFGNSTATTNTISSSNTKIDGLTVTLPNGQVWTAPSQDALNSFKKDYGL